MTLNLIRRSDDLESHTLYQGEWTFHFLFYFLRNRENTNAHAAFSLRVRLWGVGGALKKVLRGFISIGRKRNNKVTPQVSVYRQVVFLYFCPILKRDSVPFYWLAAALLILRSYQLHPGLQPMRNMYANCVRCGDKLREGNGGKLKPTQEVGAVA